MSIPFLVVGGVATRLYALERMTDDLNVLVAADQAEAFYQDLERGGSTKGAPRPDGAALDVLDEGAAWAVEAMSAPAAGPDGLPVIALPCLVLLKLRASEVLTSAT